MSGKSPDASPISCTVRCISSTFFATAFTIVVDPDDSIGDLPWAICQQNVFAVARVQTFRPQFCRYDRHARSHRLENLQATSPADIQRHYGSDCFAIERTDVVDAAGNFDA